MTRIKVVQVSAVKPTAAAAGEVGPYIFPHCTSSVKPAMVTGEIRVAMTISDGIMVTKAISKYVLSNSNN
jgi:hypothetical protein